MWAFIRVNHCRICCKPAGIIAARWRIIYSIWQRYIFVGFFCNSFAFTFFISCAFLISHFAQRLSALKNHVTGRNSTGGSSGDAQPKGVSYADILDNK